MTESVSKLLSDLISPGNESAMCLKLPLDRSNIPVHIGLHPRNQKQGVSLLYELHNVIDLRNGSSALHLTAIYHGGVFQGLKRSFRATEKKLYQQLLLSKAIAAGFQNERGSLMI
jgi:hypothetical protein